jgi:hypothetical protein
MATVWQWWRIMRACKSLIALRFLTFFIVFFILFRTLGACIVFARAARLPPLQGSKQMTTQLIKGHRIEIPTHYDLWMRGARFGVVTSVRFTSDKPSAECYATIRMDHAQVKRSVRLPRHDWQYARVIG